MSSTRYLQHLQNTSPAKTTYSFSKGQRFNIKLNNTPNKFYQYPSTRSQRSTSFGYGNKIDFINRAMGDPGSIKNLGEFQRAKLKMRNSITSSFGQSHQDIFNRKLNQCKTPGPGIYKPENYKNKSKFYMGHKIKYPEIKKFDIGPQTYEIQKCLQKVSRYKGSKSFRIKTQPSKSKLDNYPTPPGPGAYNPQKLFALQQQMLQKSIIGPVSFARQKRLKTQSKSKIGPGSYQTFSVFGDRKIRGN